MANISAIKLPDDTSYNIKAVAIPFGKLDSTSTSTAMTASVSGITELVSGVCVWLTNGVVTSASGFTININGLGAKPVYQSQAAATRSTTIFSVNYTALLIYNEDRVSGGCWDYVYGYDSNTNTIGYQVRTNSFSLPMTSIVYRYRLLFTSADGTKFVPANNSTSTNATTARSITQEKIDPFGRIVYYGTTASVAAGSRPSASYLWQQYAFTIGYSFVVTLTEWKPVYLNCAPQSDGSAIIDSTTPFVQTLPSTEDGKIYIFLGVAYSATAMELTLEHPVYYYSNGCIRQWTNSNKTEQTYNGNSSMSYTSYTNSIVNGNTAEFSCTSGSNKAFIQAGYDDSGECPVIVLGGYTSTNGNKNSLFVDPSGEITIHNLSTPVQNTDAATKGYVDTAIGAISAPVPATVNPLMDGTAAVGTSIKYAREDHVHPSDTSKVDTSFIGESMMSYTSFTNTITNGHTAKFGCVSGTNEVAITAGYDDSGEFPVLELYGKQGNAYQASIWISPSVIGIYGLEEPTQSDSPATKNYVDSSISGLSIPTKTSDLTNDAGFITGMYIASYGSSTYAEILAAYQANKVVYCRASSNNPPSSGAQNRMAFLAYVNNSTTPTEFEFQYYRSVATHSDSQQGDQVFVYKLNSSTGWSVTTREAYTKITTGTGLSKSYSNGTLTLSYSGTTPPSAATADPLMDGTAAVGSSAKYAKEDHVHPSDTSKLNVSSINLSETESGQLYWNDGVLQFNGQYQIQNEPLLYNQATIGKYYNFGVSQLDEDYNGSTSYLNLYKGYIQSVTTYGNYTAGKNFQGLIQSRSDEYNNDISLTSSRWVEGTELVSEIYLGNYTTSSYGFFLSLKVDDYTNYSYLKLQNNQTYLEVTDGTNTNTLTVTPTSTTITGNNGISTTVLTTSSNTTIGGTLDVSGATTLGSLNVTNNTAIGGNLEITGDTTFHGVVDVVPRRCYAQLPTSGNSAGWYRVLTLSGDSNDRPLGSPSFVIDITIVRQYGSSDNELHKVSLLAVYNSIAFANETSKSNNAVVDKIRYTRNGKYGYIDIHYDTSALNVVTVRFDVKAYPLTDYQFAATTPTAVADSPSGETVLTEYTFAADTEGTGTITAGAYTDSIASGTYIYRHGKIVTGFIRAVLNSTAANGWREIAIIPSGFRPISNTEFNAIDDTSTDSIQTRIAANGTVNIWPVADKPSGRNIIVSFTYYTG